MSSVGANFISNLRKTDSYAWLSKFRTLGISYNTGYDWGQLPEMLGRQETQTHNSVQAPAGTIVQVKQLVGYCGWSTIRTEVFKTEMKVSQTLKRCLPTDSFELVIQCDARREATVSVKFFSQKSCSAHPTMLMYSLYRFRTLHKYSRSLFMEHYTYLFTYTILYKPKYSN
jgi:hypothetical protein